MGSRPSARSHDSKAGTAARILIADDHLSHRELLRFALEACGHEVAEAEDGEQVMEQAPAFAPDLFILDLDMPKMNGYAAANALRAIPAFEKTPIVALTAVSSDKAQAEIMLAGFSEYLIKPVGPTRLRECIATLL